MDKVFDDACIDVCGFRQAGWGAYQQRSIATFGPISESASPCSLALDRGEAKAMVDALLDWEGATPAGSWQSWLATTLRAFARNAIKRNERRPKSIVGGYSLQKCAETVALLAIGYAAVCSTTTSAHAALISVATPGNILALLPDTAIAVSSLNNYGLSKSQVVDNQVNTMNQDNGQVFGNTDTSQFLAITGFNSGIGDIRVYTSPADAVRFPATLTAYYSVMSTLSLDPGSSAYTGSSGGQLLPLTALATTLFTPVPNSTSAYADFVVFAPVGTQTLLLNFGSANGGGDRISELQAFAVPEPTSLILLAGGLLGFTLRLRSRVKTQTL